MIIKLEKNENSAVSIDTKRYRELHINETRLKVILKALELKKITRRQILELIDEKNISDLIKNQELNDEKISKYVLEQHKQLERSGESG